MDNNGVGPHKEHKVPKAGRKAERKKDKARERQGVHSNAKHNPKAFAPTSARGAAKQFMRKQELVQRKLHVPLVDRSNEELPPPVVVAVVGPPGVGKSTLIKCMVKRFTRHSLPTIKGPITVVSGKKRRLIYHQ